jgi:hypothetical protein
MGKRLTESKTMRSYLQHYCNPVHIWCRLVDCGMSRERARMIAKWYQFLVWEVLYV